jgi:1-acyl-sn-glycerol-3-phosphate acyltransferase
MSQKALFLPVPEATLRYRLVRSVFMVLLRLLARLDVEGVDRVPRSGPLVLAPNHLHFMDGVVTVALAPRAVAAFSADKWRGKPFGWIMSFTTRVIYVARGEPDRQAMNEALAYLRSGGALGVAPEGTRSRTGRLQKGRSGAVYLASRAGAPIVPMVLWGQENTFHDLKRLRRPHIHVRFAEPIRLPESAKSARTAELETYTDQLMLTIARLLPAEYRGEYADRA